MNKAVCDRSGFTLPASKLKKTWDGLLVRKESFEQRHPQDFPARAKAESQPEITNAPKDIFLTSNTGVNADITVLVTPTIIEAVTSTDLEVTTTPTAQAASTFIAPGDVTPDDL